MQQYSKQLVQFDYNYEILLIWSVNQFCCLMEIAGDSETDDEPAKWVFSQLIG